MKITPVNLYKVTFTPATKGIVRSIDYFVVAENRQEAIDAVLGHASDIFPDYNTVITEMILTGFKGEHGNTPKKV